VQLVVMMKMKMMTHGSGELSGEASLDDMFLLIQLLMMKSKKVKKKLLLQKLRFTFQDGDASISRIDVTLC
jgi:hypothetical protein